MKFDLIQICEQVKVLAQQTAKYIAHERENFSESSVEHKGLHDLVSYVDKEAEKQLVTGLLNLLPEAGIIGEEGTSEKKSDTLNWVIDPLDGTTNFIQNIPVYSISIGLMQDAEIILGVVYDICRNECFYATKDGGAFLNGNKIAVSPRSNINEALLATGFPYTNFEQMDQYMDVLRWAMFNARGVRRLGSAAIDMCYVACGRFDGFWEQGLKAWDVCAGTIIVNEAGGKVSDYVGGENYVFGNRIVASNPKIYDIIIEQTSKLE